MKKKDLRPQPRWLQQMKPLSNKIEEILTGAMEDPDINYDVEQIKLLLIETMEGLIGRNELPTDLIKYIQNKFRAEIREKLKSI